MKASDLSRAQRLIAQRDKDAAMEARLNSGEPLSLLLGEKAGSVEIVVAASFLASIRATLADSFKRRVEASETELQQMGVEL